VFTTLRASDGAAAGLDAHLARLAASVRALYGRPLPAGLRAATAAAAAAAADPGACRVRADVRPDGTFAVAAAPLAPLAPGPVALVPVTVPGGLGAHKWSDRRLLEALEAHVAPALPLLVDLDGAVLEASRASVVAVGAGGIRTTPPADGRILPGTTRAALLARGAVTETPLTLADLDGAAAIELAWALRGVTPAVLA